MLTSRSKSDNTANRHDMTMMRRHIPNMGSYGYKEATAYKELYILVSIHSCSLHSITHATQLLSSLNYSCYSVALFTRLLMLLSCSLYPITQTSPTVFFSRNHIILPIGVASSRGRYLKFSSQRRRKFLSTAASETERKRPADAVLSWWDWQISPVGSFG